MSDEDRRYGNYGFGKGLGDKPAFKAPSKTRSRSNSHSNEVKPSHVVDSSPITENEATTKERAYNEQYLRFKETQAQLESTNQLLTETRTQNDRVQAQLNLSEQLLAETRKQNELLLTQINNLTKKVEEGITVGNNYRTPVVWPKSAK